MRCTLLSSAGHLSHLGEEIRASTVLSVGVISDTLWWKVPFLTSRRQPRSCPVSSQSGHVASCRACNVNAMTGPLSGPFGVTRCRTAALLCVFQPAAALRTVLLLTCTTYLGNKCLILVLVSLSTGLLLFLVSLLLYSSFTLSTVLCLGSLVFLLAPPTVSSPRSRLSRIGISDSSRHTLKKKRNECVKTPCPQPRVPLIFLTRKAHKVFLFFPLAFFFFWLFISLSTLVCFTAHLQLKHKRCTFRTLPWCRLSQPLN